MELRLSKSMTPFFWRIYPVVMIFTSIYRIFYDWKLQLFGFNELEDVGTLVFVLGVSACESALIVWILWLVSRIFSLHLEKVLKNK